jgi:hypothetical protein
LPVFTQDPELSKEEVGGREVLYEYVLEEEEEEEEEEERRRRRRKKSCTKLYKNTFAYLPIA